VLLVRDGAGWTLPHIESEERRSADVALLNRSAREGLGVEISVLRCLRDAPADANGVRSQVYEAESHARAPPSALKATAEPGAPGVTELGTRSGTRRSRE
jgi:hypothetical protein